MSLTSTIIIKGYTADRFLKPVSCSYQSDRFIGNISRVKDKK